MAGQLTTANFTRSQHHDRPRDGHRETPTYGTRFLKATSVAPAGNTALVPLTHQINAVQPQCLSKEREVQQPSSPLSHASVGSGTINDVAFQTVPMFMSVWHVTMTPTQTTAIINRFIAKRTPTANAVLHYHYWGLHNAPCTKGHL